MISYKMYYKYTLSIYTQILSRVIFKLKVKFISHTECVLPGPASGSLQHKCALRKSRHKQRVGTRAVTLQCVYMCSHPLTDTPQYAPTYTAGDG